MGCGSKGQDAAFYPEGYAKAPELTVRRCSKEGNKTTFAGVKPQRKYAEMHFRQNGMP
jgi:hypothetical protein